MASNLTVHVIDDDDAAREALTLLLKAAKYSVCSYNSAVEFVKSLSNAAAGCIVTDLRMPEMTGLDLLRHLKSRAITLPVIVITGHGDVSLAIEAIKAGAVDFIEKPYDAEALLDAIKAAFSEHTRDATRAAEKTNIQQRIASLSAGERRILDALIAGRPNNAIAFDLQLSPRAVEINRASIMSKMQATNLSHLVRMALLAS